MRDDSRSDKTKSLARAIAKRIPPQLIDRAPAAGELATHAAGNVPTSAPPGTELLIQALATLTTGRRKPKAQKLQITGLRNPISGQDMILLAQDRAAYLQLGFDHFRDLAPVGVREIQIVQQLVDLTWRLNRLGAIENNLMISGMVEVSKLSHTSDPRTDAVFSLASGFRKDCDQSQTFGQLGRYEASLRRQIDNLDRAFDRMSSRRTRTASGDSVVITIAIARSQALVWYQEALESGAQIRSLT